jgi:type VI secretion system secreted protein VgrG
MAKLDLSQAEFLFHSDALPKASLDVYHFSGHESMSQPFEFQIDLVCADPDLDLEAPISQGACLTLRGRLFDGSRYNRHVHGVIERFVQLGAGTCHSRYQATLVPSIKPLAFTRDSRIFQKQSTPDISQAILKDDRIPGDWISPMLHGSYAPRDYCVQYQESDLNFIQRLWEEEGVFYFFEHQNDKDKLVLGDGGYAFSELPAYAEIRLRDTQHLYEECLFEFRAESALRPGATVLRDFKFKQPALNMEVTAQSDKFSAFKLYYFPGEYVDPGMGQQLAKVRLEEQQCQKNRYVARGNVRALLPGHTFEVKGHRRNDCNQKYLILSVQHEGTQSAALGEEGGKDAAAPSYENQMECIPAKVPYRPARETPVPSIQGVQTAIVVGPPGEEIHCDEHGRVKVQFHWDRQGKKDDDSSCWVRVSQPWGGVGQGGVFIPRIGQEVVVQFLEGDPDRPLIVGRVYNGENPVPHGLPAAKNISTIRSASTPGGGGFNELKFDDTAGSELVFFHAQKDHNEIVGHDHEALVKNDQRETVQMNRQAMVGINENLRVGADQSLAVGANRMTTIGANQTTTVGANRTTSIGANKTTSVGGSHTESVSGSMTVSVMKNLTETVAINYAETVGAAMELTIGGAFVQTVGGIKQVSVGGLLNETIGISQSTEVGTVASLRAGEVISHTAGQIIAASAGQQIIVSAGQKIAITAGEEISVKTGSAELILKSSGDIVVKGTNITVKASGDVAVKGSKISLN